VAEQGLPVEGLEDHFGAGYVVAEVVGDPVGVGGVEVYSGDGLLRSVAVIPEWRGRAVGRAVVEDRVAWSRARGLGALYLLTETAPGFFERLGFERVGREAFPEAVRKSKEFSEVCPDTAVAMRRVL
jgi:N-acetylglutamate synthase-like GNAT family acetyltransferase